jgi:hypothetical protein
MRDELAHKIELVHVLRTEGRGIARQDQRAGAVHDVREDAAPPLFVQLRLDGPEGEQGLDDADRLLALRWPDGHGENERAVRIGLRENRIGHVGLAAHRGVVGLPERALDFRVEGVRVGRRGDAVPIEGPEDREARFGVGVLTQQLFFREVEERIRGHRAREPDAVRDLLELRLRVRDVRVEAVGKRYGAVLQVLLLGRLEGIPVDADEAEVQEGERDDGDEDQGDEQSRHDPQARNPGDTHPTLL